MIANSFRFALLISCVLCLLAICALPTLAEDSGLICVNNISESEYFCYKTVEYTDTISIEVPSYSDDSQAGDWQYSRCEYLADCSEIVGYICAADSVTKKVWYRMESVQHGQPHTYDSDYSDTIRFYDVVRWDNYLYVLCKKNGCLELSAVNLSDSKPEVIRHLLYTERFLGYNYVIAGKFVLSSIGAPVAVEAILTKNRTKRWYFTTDSDAIVLHQQDVGERSSHLPTIEQITVDQPPGTR